MKKAINFIVSIFKHFFVGLWYIISFFPKYLVLGILTIFGRKNYIKKKFNKSWFSVLMLVISVIIYLGCVFYITRRFVQNERIKVLSQWITTDTEILMEDESSELDDGSEEEPEVTEEQTETETVNYSSSAQIKYADISSNKQINPDTVAWIWVNGTNVDYPVVQTDDNSYYLDHDFYRNSYYSGWVFADYRDNFETFGRNTIIYAHNSLNGKMFSSLTWMLNDGWFDDEYHRYIELSTENSNSVWQIFSVYTIEPEIYYLTTGFTDETYDTFLQTIASRTFYNFGVGVDISDKVLTLQTCTNTGNRRIVVHAKLYRFEYR